MRRPTAAAKAKYLEGGREKERGGGRERQKEREREHCRRQIHLHLLFRDIHMDAVRAWQRTYCSAIVELVHTMCNTMFADFAYV